MKKFYLPVANAGSLKRIFLTYACIIIVSLGYAQTNTWDGSASTSWNTAANWSLDLVPTAAHDVVIPNNFNVTVNTAAVCKSFTINGGGNANTIAISGTNSLTVSESLIINAGTTSADHKSIVVGGGSLTAGFVEMAATGNNNRTNFISVSSGGTVTVTNNITMLDVIPARNYIQSTGTGIINLGGSISGGDVLSAATSTFNYNGSVAQTVVINGYQYGNLKLNNSSGAGATLGGAITGTVVTTDINIESGILNNGGFAISLSTGDDFIMGEGTTFNLTGTSGMPVVAGVGVTTLPTTSTVRFAGNFQNIAADTYGNLIIEGSGDKLMNADITVAGDFTMSAASLVMTDQSFATYTMTLLGDFTHTGGTITESAFLATGIISFNGTAEQVFASGGTVSNTINFVVTNGALLQMAAENTIVSGNSFNIQSGGTLGIRSVNGIRSAPVNSGNIRTTTRTFSAGANYVYNGSANQVTGNGLSANTPANLFIENPGFTVSLSGNTTVSSDVVIRQGTLSSGAYTLNLAGNWTNNGTGFTPGAGLVVLSGTASQTIGGLTSTTFNNLHLNKSSGTVALGQDINVNGTMNIGVNLSIASHILTMGASSPAIGTFGGASGVFSATKMIVASGGGELRKAATTAAQASYTFPIGDNSGTTEFSPASVAFTGGSYAGFVSAKVIDEKHPSLFHINNFLTRYWTIEQSGFSGFSATVNFTYVDADIVGSEAFIRLGKWDGADPWTRFDPSITPGSNLLSATVTSFSDFTGMSLLEALPVKLVSFTASLVNKSGELKWISSEEVNNSHYEVERSSNGTQFDKIGTVTSQNSITGSTYRFTDKNLSAGKNYYRLKMVDIDGKFEYSPVVMLNNSESLRILNVYPNPTTSGVTVQFEKASTGATIRIVNMEGRMLNLLSVPANSTQMSLSLGGLVPGTYNIIYSNNGEQYTQRIQKQ